MKTALRKITPKPIWDILVAGKHSVTDAIDLSLGRSSSLVPPRHLRAYVGHGEFLKTGHEFLGYFKEHGLQPSDRVLDIGCGIGRMAIPLTDYISRHGSYDGFDIVEHGVTWCTKTITEKFPNFRFHHSDIYNKMYNPNGKLAVEEFRFPYPDATFDFVFLTSVFTHMRKKDVAHYLAEISRVTRPGGKCLITWFVLTEQSAELIRTGISSLNFAHRIDDEMTIDRETPEEAIAFDEQTVRKLYSAHGIQIDTIHPGSWCGRPSYVSYQDICVGTKL